MNRSFSRHIPQGMVSKNGRFVLFADKCGGARNHHSTLLPQDNSGKDSRG